VPLVDDFESRRRLWRRLAGAWYGTVVMFVLSPKGDAMPTSRSLDSLGRRRSPASVPGYLAGRPPRSKGRRYPADPPRTEEIIAVMRCCRDGLHGAPQQLRHAHALELLREGVMLNVIQRQLGHRNLGVTSIYLQGIDPDEIIQTMHARRPPMIPASVGLALPRTR
jgi:hypothetical protein